MPYPTSIMSRIFRLKGTVILHTWWQISLVIIYTSGVISYHLYINKIVFDTAILVDILGIVTGLLLAFRTQTSYERFSQGRSLWAEMTLQIRNMTRLIWIFVVGHDSVSIVEKKSVINLLIAFAVAVKHHLRDEFGYKHEDLKDFLSHIVVTRGPPAQHPNCDLSAEAFVHRSYDDIVTTCRDVKRSNIPIEITHYISTYIHLCSERNKCDRATISAMHKGVSKMVECLTSFEKIQSTPIPVAYSVHLTHLTLIYTLAVPFQIVNKFGWYTLPIVTLVAFAFLGILEIGQEIENPFSYEPNDLPLDKFCRQIRSEIEVILTQSPKNAHEWIFSSKNMPFLPWSFQTGAQLARRSPEELMTIISRSGGEGILTTPEATQQAQPLIQPHFTSI